jgi:hypothetical protein
MDRSVALLCLIGLDRSRVIFLSLARYRLSLYYIIWFTVYIQDEMNGNLETGRGMMMMYRYGSRTGFLGVLAPSVSVKGRTIIGPADHV